MKYTSCLSIIATKLDKDLDKVTKRDIKNFIADIQQREDYSPWTKQGYKVIVKKFYQWLHQTKDYPEIISWISIGISLSQTKLPTSGELLTEEDIKKILSVIENKRDKAFLITLWESGTRIGEIGNLRLKNINISKQGTVLTVKGKTGSRQIRLITSTPYLLEWLEIHPTKDNIDSHVWINIGVTNNNEGMNYRNIAKTVKKYFKLAGVKKKCNPHFFRHSRATFMANHLTEFQMNQYFGWKQGSDMPATYVHLSGKDVDNAIFTMNGIKVKDKKEESQLTSRICPYCKSINTFNSVNCRTCYKVIDQKVKIVEKRREVVKDNKLEMLELLMKHPKFHALWDEVIEKMAG